MGQASILSLEEAKGIANITKSDTDSVMENALLRSTELILQYLGIATFEKGSYSQIFNSIYNINRFYPLYLSTLAIDEAAAFNVYYSPSRTWAVGDLLNASEYYVDFAHRRVEVNAYTCANPRAIKVECTSGFDVVPALGDEIAYYDIPDAYSALKGACHMQVMHMFDKYRNRGVSTQTSGRNSKMKALLTNETRELLLPYKQHKFFYV